MGKPKELNYDKHKVNIISYNKETFLIVTCRQSENKDNKK